MFIIKRTSGLLSQRGLFKMKLHLVTTLILLVLLVSCLEAKKGKKGKGKKLHRKSSEKSVSASIEDTQGEWRDRNSYLYRSFYPDRQGSERQSEESPEEDLFWPINSWQSSSSDESQSSEDSQRSDEDTQLLVDIVAGAINGSEDGIRRLTSLLEEQVEAVNQGRQTSVWRDVWGAVNGDEDDMRRLVEEYGENVDPDSDNSAWGEGVFGRQSDGWTGQWLGAGNSEGSREYGNMKKNVWLGWDRYSGESDESDGSELWSWDSDSDETGESDSSQDGSITGWDDWWWNRRDDSEDSRSDSHEHKKGKHSGKHSGSKEKHSHEHSKGKGKGKGKGKHSKEHGHKGKHSHEHSGRNSRSSSESSEQRWWSLGSSGSSSSGGGESSSSEQKWWSSESSGSSSSSEGSTSESSGSSSSSEGSSSEENVIDPNWCVGYCFKWVKKNLRQVFSDPAIARIFLSSIDHIILPYCHSKARESGCITNRNETTTTSVPTTTRPVIRSCDDYSDCMDDECCAYARMNDLGFHRFQLICQRLTEEGESCYSSPINSYTVGSVYRRCPCSEGLECTSDSDNIFYGYRRRCRRIPGWTTSTTQSIFRTDPTAIVTRSSGEPTTDVVTGVWTESTTDESFTVDSTTTATIDSNSTTTPSLNITQCSDHMDCPFFQCCYNPEAVNGDAGSGYCLPFSNEGESCSQLSSFMELSVVNACPCQSFLKCSSSAAAGEEEGTCV